jgi:Ku protein
VPRNSGVAAELKGGKHQTISMGLMNVPVRIKSIELSARAKGNVSWSNICPDHKTKCKTARYCEDGDHYVESVKGFLVNGSYIEVDEEILDACAAERTAEIAIEYFVDAGEISPLYYKTAYILGPDGPSTTYDLLAHAMQAAGVAGVGNAVLTGTKSTALIVIRFDEAAGCLLAHSCKYDAAIDWQNIDTVSNGLAGRPTPSAQHMKLAGDVIKGLKRKFDPAPVEDEFNKAKRELLERCAAGAPLPTPAAATAPAAKGDDIMTALSRMVEEQKGKTAAKPKKVKA